MCICFQDLPLGLMNDIYEWCKNFSIRIDEVEEASFKNVHEISFELKPGYSIENMRFLCRC